MTDERRRSEEEAAADPAAASSEGIDEEADSEQTTREVADAFDSRPADRSDEDRPDADPLEVARAETAQYREHLQRLQAEFENYRKRVLREQTQAVELAARPVIDRLLEVLDDFDLALMHAQDRPDFDRFLHGVELVYAKLVDTLRAEGLERIEAQGKPFDPEQHEALMQSGDGDGDPVVADVLRPGYTLKGRVLRPAGVRVERK
ncbi:MAG TPA: nucleotide exchange factor GrpE [Actinomycetota bacterium]|nr:nucleotide exchange factor GrpE [Actinomycetota bacterium]